MPLNTLHDAISNIGSTLFAPRWIHSPLLWLPLIGAILSGSEPVHHLEESFGLPLLFELRGPRQAPDHVVLVTIDELTATSLSLPRSVSRWPRSVHACVIEQFLATAKQIAIDINFVGKSSPPIFVSVVSLDVV